MGAVSYSSLDVTRAVPPLNCLRALPSGGSVVTQEEKQQHSQRGEIEAQISQEHCLGPVTCLRREELPTGLGAV